MLRILHLEDDEADGLLVHAEIAKEFGCAHVERVESGRAFCAALQHGEWDVVIADNGMAGFNAFVALKYLQESGRDVPFIVVSGSMGEDLAVEAMKAGAHDFVTKSNLPRLGPAVRRELRDAAVRRDRAQVEVMLEMAQERLAVVLESTQDRVFTFDPDLRVSAVYGTWLRDEGVAAEDLVGKTPGEVFGEDLARHERHYRRALDGAHEVYEWHLEGAAGRRHFQTSLSPLRAPDRKVVGGVGIIRDITRLKEMEGQLVMSERLVSVGTLAASVAHEINNPLASVVTNLTFALEEAAEVPEPRRAQLLEVLADARSATVRVRDIVRDLRILSRSDDEAVGPVDVCKVLDAAVRLAWNEVRHRARLERHLAPTPPVRGSEARLGQVFLNLLVNAAQAIPEGHANANRIVLRTGVGDGGLVTVEIEDTGCGMSREVLSRIFTPFFTTKPAGVGTGLGLSISQRIVAALGGRIEATSTPGRGSLFRVQLPPETAAASIAPAPRPPAAPAARRRGRVLVVDDDEDVARAIHRTLAPQHEVVIADGPSAVERIERGEAFDVVLCDLMMPVMTGMEVYARIRAQAPSLADSMVFVSGGAFSPAAQEFLSQRAARFIAKPFEPEELRRSVDEVLS